MHKRGKARQGRRDASPGGYFGAVTLVGFLVGVLVLLGIGFLITFFHRDFNGVGDLVQGAVTWAVGIGVVLFLIAGFAALTGGRGACIPFFGCL